MYESANLRHAPECLRGPVLNKLYNPQFYDPYCLPVLTGESLSHWIVG